MHEIVNDGVVAYLRKTIRENPPFFQAMEQYAEEHKIFIVQKEVGRLQSLLVSLLRPKRILEIGTAIGYSALLMYEASGKQAKIVTMEQNADVAAVAWENMKKYGADRDMTLVLGDAAVELDKVSGTFDLLFIDAAKGQYPVFLEKALPLLRPGGVIVTDNVLYKGKTAYPDYPEHKHRTIVTRLRGYLTMLCEDERFDTALIPIGDGVALTRFLEGNETKEN